ncbi:phosphate ABC transporter substrate-binding/OmpA family protein [Roseobacter sp. CCS2]|uniref:phosphate ABC transporter substrate-binding/OmpA family protein n=1 Tax=Roseobacter sp. CCS2 TaxID=391593 RepID=UPI0018DB241C|nr:phosphate ABC transporter substrate-binding/OmpA family protein [Roseobacter sp. CCS2]
MNARSTAKLTCLLFLGAVTPMTAAYADVTLTALDGSFEMKGASVTFDDENYFLEGPQGQLIVQREFVSCLGDGCPAEEIASSAVDDNKVELVSLDGSFSLSGTLLEVTTADFVIQTGDGSVTVQREFVTCKGAACPSTTVDKTNFAIAVSNTDGASLLSSIIAEFAASKDFGVTRFVGGEDIVSTILIGNEQGEEVANVQLIEMDTSAAIQAVMNGSVTMALTQDEVSADALAEMTGVETDDVSTVLNETTVGLDGISFVTNPDNRINVLDLENLRSVLTGEVTNWAELGGADAAINVHMMAPGAGVTQQLAARLLNDASLADGHNIAETTQELNTAVKSDPYALGVLYRSQVEDTKTLDLVGSCDIFFDNSDFSIQTEEYPLTVRWNQYTTVTGDMPEIAENISEFIATDFGQQIIAAEGLIAQELRVLPIKDQGGRLLTSVLASGDSRIADDVTRTYLAEIANAERLSTSLRFLTGQAVLDTKAIADIKRISSIVRSAEYEGYEVLVFGFTDSVGTINNNIALAERRAQTVKDVLIAENAGILDDETVSIFGMGPIAPVNCNDTSVGRDLNRRVEVWIRPRA